MSDTVEDVQARWPFTREPLWNSAMLTNVSGCIRSQVLTCYLGQLQNPSLLKYLREAQDDITTAIALVEKRLGVKE